MVDPTIDVVYGPHPVQNTGTVTVPRDLLREVGVEPGNDKVHWALNPDIPGTLLLIPAKLLARTTDATLELLRQVR
jgi:hypothetical protein